MEEALPARLVKVLEEVRTATKGALVPTVDLVAAIQAAAAAEMAEALDRDCIESGWDGDPYRIPDRSSPSIPLQNLAVTLLHPLPDFSTVA